MEVWSHITVVYNKNRIFLCSAKIYFEKTQMIKLKVVKF